MPGVSGGSGRGQVGQAPAWWDIFENQVVIEQIFRISLTALLSLSEMLRSHIQGQVTVMRLPVDVVKYPELLLLHQSCGRKILFNKTLAAT